MRWRKKLKLKLNKNKYPNKSTEKLKMNKHHTSDRINNTITLNNNMQMPIIGIGTFKSEDTVSNIYECIKAGFRLIDTALVYKNEEQVGQGIKKAIEDGIVKRSDLFVVTKLWLSQRHEAEKALKSQLHDLQLEYVDLYLLHWAIPQCVNGNWDFGIPMHKVWESMENLVELGLTKAIGISNMNVQMMLDMMCYAKIKPVVNQFEINPYFSNEEVRKCCKALGIEVMAYNSLHKGTYLRIVEDDLFADELIVEISKKYEKTSAQIVLNWALMQDVIVIPKSSNLERAKENLEAVNFRLDEADVHKIKGLNKNKRYCTGFAFMGGLDNFA